VDNKAEKIKWWNALDAITATHFHRDSFQWGISLAYRSQDPDARWFCALLPAEGVTSKEEMARVMAAQGDDPRALYLRASWLSEREEPLQKALLRRAGKELGFLPALVALALSRDPDRIAWLENAEKESHPRGTMLLALSLLYGRDCAKKQSAGRPADGAGCVVGLRRRSLALCQSIWRQ